MKFFARSSAASRSAAQKSRRRQEFRRAMFETLEDRRVLAIGNPPVAEWQASAHATDRMLVRFNSNVTQASADQLMRENGAYVAQWWGELNLAAVSIYATDLPDAAIAKASVIHHLGDVKYAEPDFYKTPARVPGDTRYANNQWSLNNTAQSGGLAGADIDAQKAWDLATGTSNEVIAILDSGVDYAHPDLRDNMWTNPREIQGDGVDNDSNGYIDDYYGYDFGGVSGGTVRDSDPKDVSGHGTAVASVAAASGNNNVGITGVSWNSKIMAVKVMDDAGAILTSSEIAGILYVNLMKTRGNVNVVAANASFTSTTRSNAELDAIRTLNDSGVLFVAAAGNATANNDSTPSYPASYNLPGIISVAATNDRDVLASTSNYGITTVDLAAPGGDVIDPLRPTRLNQQILVAQPITVDPTGYAFLFGTSFAAPMVTGAIAVIAGYSPGIAPSEIKRIILEGVDKLPSLTNTTVTGGRLNLFNSLNLLPSNTISGSVYRDDNGDGLRAPQEASLANWTVYIDRNNNGSLDSGDVTTTTDSGGNFQFKGVYGPGTLNIREVVQTGYSQTTPKNNAAAVVTLASKSDTFSGVTFGNKPVPGTISGIVFNDGNRDLSQQSYEGGVGNIFVYVDLNNDGKPGLGEPGMYTGSNGLYSIAVPPGVYTVREAASPGYEQTAPDPNGADKGTRPVVVVVGGVDTGFVNFGNIPAYDYGDLPASYELFQTSNNIGSTSANAGVLQGFSLGLVGPDGDSSIAFQPFSPNASADATGDDKKFVSDEDGVSFLNFTPGSTTATIRVKVSSGTFPAGYLNGWVDWNNNGRFEPNEKVISEQQVGTGTYNYAVSSVSSPMSASPPAKGYFARFRYSLDPNVPYYGATKAGEVEDYLTGIERNTPLATDDQFSVKQSSTGNKLDVLANDVKSVNGLPRLAPIYLVTTGTKGTVTYKDNGTPNVFTDDYFDFAPTVGFIGTTSFTYKVVDPAGKLSDPATVTITVTARPKPVDDTFSINATNALSQLNVVNLPVLANDGQSSGGLIMSIQPNSITVPVGASPSLLSRLTINNDGTIKYTPPSTLFVGIETFSYSAGYRDGNIATNPVGDFQTATVTVQVGDVAAAATTQANITLNLFKVVFTPDPLGGFIKTFVPATIDALTGQAQYNVGDTIAVIATSKDTRAPLGGPADYRGVEAAFVDLNFDTDFVSPLRDSTQVDDLGQPLIPANGVEFGPIYTPLTSGVGNYAADTAGQLGEVGGFRASANGTYLGTGDIKIFTAYFTAKAPTTTEPASATSPAGTTQFVADPADVTPERDVLENIYTATNPPATQIQVKPILDSQVALKSSPFVSIKAVAGGEFANQYNILDVNADGSITPNDVLIVINELNGAGARPLSASTMALLGKILPAGFIDTNSDGILSPLDALLVINYINAHSGTIVSGESGSANSIVADSSGVVSMAAGSPVTASDSPVAATASDGSQVIPGVVGSSAVVSDSSSGAKAVAASSPASNSSPVAIDSVLSAGIWDNSSDSSSTDSSSESVVDATLDDLLAGLVKTSRSRK